MKNNKLTAISLFCSSGIADLAIHKHGVKTLVANELLNDRASLYWRNFPGTLMIQGDVWKNIEKIVNETKRRLNGQQLDIVFATPPCQGMSKNGKGKLLNLIRDNLRPKIDPRNRLVIPTIEIVKKLQPTTLIMENVPEMKNTVIDDENGNYINIVGYIKDSLGKEYLGKAEEVQFADFGIPQRRKRLITIFTKDEKLKKHFNQHKSFIPSKTHSKKGGMFSKKWISVRDAIGFLPPLDAKDKNSASSDIPFHYVPVLDKKKYIWISNTPPEKGAFDNQCINTKCGYKKNPTHGSKKDGNGINKANKNTPLYCKRCNSLLPRPYVKEKDGTLRLMSGYTSAYKRMRWSLPSPTLTTNLSYPSSDHKLHPDQNRVISIHEAFILHTLDKFNYVWKDKSGTQVKDTLIKDVIGESIPPKFFSILIEHFKEAVNN